MPVAAADPVVLRVGTTQDLDAINRQADALNAEVEDVLSYQVDV